MQLDRNMNADGSGKYALLKLRQGDKPFSTEEKGAINLLTREGRIDFGTSYKTDFFVIRLRDEYAAPALFAYANAAVWDDPEYAREVRELANMALNHPNKKKPD